MNEWMFEKKKQSKRSKNKMRGIARDFVNPYAKSVKSLLKFCSATKNFPKKVKKHEMSASRKA
jgi:hypothetical protein